MSFTRRITIVLVDAHEVLRLGLRTLLQGDPLFHVVGEAGTLAEAVRLTDRLEPALVVTEMALPDGSGVDLCRDLAARSPQVRVVVLTTQVSDASVITAVRAGACGYLSKHLPAAELLRALRAAASGQPQLDPQSVRSLVERMRRDGNGGGVKDVLTLTEQERRVLALVTEGKTNKEIATVLGLSEKTIKNYLSHAFEKLNVTRRAQAAVRFMSDVRYLGAAVAPAASPEDSAHSGRPPVVRHTRLGSAGAAQEPKSA